MLARFKSVLCFGDSITHGLKCAGGVHERYDRNVRWPGVLGNALGPNWEIIEEGHCGRTIDRDDPIKGARQNGSRYLHVCLETHRPFDFVVLFLGTNDLKACYTKSASDIGVSIEKLVIEIKTFIELNKTKAEIVLVSPPLIEENLALYSEKFRGGRRKSQDLSQIYNDIAERQSILFFDAAPVSDAKCSDGIHIDLESHKRIGSLLASMLTSRCLTHCREPQEPG